MARRRFRRKDLKRPDEFVTLGTRFFGWLQANARPVAYGAGAVAVIALLVLGIVSARNARVQQANEDLSQALVQFQAGQYSQAATALADVANRWHSTAAGQLAALYAANADLQADNVESAVLLLDQVLQLHEWPAYLRQQAALDMGYALEQKGDVKGAATRYAAAAALDGPYTSAAILGEARCRERSGEKEQARQLYARYAQEFPQASEAELAAAKAAALKG